MRILVAQSNYTIGALERNADKIIASIEKGREEGCDLILFSELAICGYPPEDLLLLGSFVDEMERQLERICRSTKGICALVGTVRRNDGMGKSLFNSSALLADGELLSYQDKSLLPTYDIFTEHRYFEPAPSASLIEVGGERVGILVCEDMWQHADVLPFANYHRDPVAELAVLKPDVVVNLSASPFSLRQLPLRFSVASQAAATLGVPLLLCNQVGGNDSLIFDGGSLVVNGQGQLCMQGAAFKEDHLVVDTENLPAPHLLRYEPTEALLAALELGVRDYFEKQHFTKACIGLSGGIDSALVAAIASRALGPDLVLGVIMPSRYSSQESRDDAIELAENLGIEWREIPIEEPFKAYLELLEPHFEGRAVDATEENIQARIRGMILMALSNKLGYILLSTGNKSENAIGYSTLYGDLCGGLAVISDVAKTEVYHLAEWINKEQEVIPSRILTKEPSAELREGQKDSDSLPPYPVLDLVLQEYVENHRSGDEIAQIHSLDLELVKDLISRIHHNEYKRRQSPPGLRVTEKAFSVGRRLPIVQDWQS